MWSSLPVLLVYPGYLVANTRRNFKSGIHRAIKGVDGKVVYFFKESNSETHSGSVI